MTRSDTATVLITGPTRGTVLCLGSRQPQTALLGTPGELSFSLGAHPSRAAATAWSSGR
jgi:hypothetical protein